MESLEVNLARLDERIKSLSESLERSERERDRAIRLAADELSRRLEILNHSHQRAVEVQSTYVPREVSEVAAKEVEARLKVIEGDLREQRGRLWIPMLIIGGIAAAVGASVVAFLLRTP